MLFILLCTFFCSVQAELTKEYTAVRVGTGLCVYDKAAGAVFSGTVGPLYMGDYQDGNWTFQPNGIAIIELHKEESGSPLTVLGGGGATMGLFRAFSPAVTTQILLGVRDTSFVFGGRAGVRLSIAELGGLELAWQQLKKTPELQVLISVDFGAFKNAFRM